MLGRTAPPQQQSALLKGLLAGTEHAVAPSLQGLQRGTWRP